MSACKAGACNKAKDCFDFFHADVFLPQNRTVEMNVECMGTRAPEWGGITLPAKARGLEKGKKNIAAVVMLQQLPYKSAGALIPSN